MKFYAFLNDLKTGKTDSNVHVLYTKANNLNILTFESC